MNGVGVDRRCGQIKASNIVTRMSRSGSQQGPGSQPIESGSKLLREGSSLILDDEDHLPSKTDVIVHATPPHQWHAAKLTRARSSRCLKQDSWRKSLRLWLVRCATTETTCCSSGTAGWIDAPALA